MAVSKSKLSELAEADRQLLESWLIDFEDAWHEQLLPERITQLPDSPSPLRLAALAEMVKIDIERQWQAGHQVGLESYLEQYAELGTPQTVAADLIHAEYEVRRQFGVPAELAEFEQRFPQQAGELRQLVAGSTGSTIAPVNSPQRSTNSLSLSKTVVGHPEKFPGKLPREFGRYRILKKLGKGGMGSVYLAHDTQLDRQVALKIPHFHSDDGPDILERFYTEARSAAALSHPNLCPVHDVGELDGIAYLTMAYIEGRPMSAYVDPEKPLPQRQGAAVVRKLALALQEAHKHGVIHRDLKPDNVMINQRNQPVIMDFGLARQVKRGDIRLTQTGDLMGTPAYMSPEQVEGDPQAMGTSCDIYSLGVILYELLTGHLPFEGSVASVLGQIVQVEPAAPSTHRADVDAELEAICLKAMAKKPEERYASMQELANALAEYLRHSQSGRTGGDLSEDSSTAGARSSVSLGSSFFGQLADGEMLSELAQIRRRTKATWRGLGAEKWIIATALLAAGLFLSVVIFVTTDEGTVRLEFAGGRISPEHQVTIDGEVIRIEKLGEPITVRTGDHNLVIKRGDVVVDTRDFRVVKGEKTLVRVTLIPASSPTSPASQSAPTPRIDAAKVPPLAVAPFDSSTAQQHQQDWADCLGISVETTNSIGMKLKLIPPGEFLMGSPESEKGRHDNEKQHRVKITRGFYLGIHEVTQREWKSVMGTEPWKGEPSVAEGTDYPAVFVSWEDATEFCRKLSAKEGTTYRLPTEAEWEYSCRSGTTTTYSCGAHDSSLAGYARTGFGDEPNEKYAFRVGQQKPNPWGLYDMHGNVWEWCADWLGYGYFATSRVEDPQGPISAQTRASAHL